MAFIFDPQELPREQKRFAFTIAIVMNGNPIQNKTLE